MEELPPIDDSKSIESFKCPITQEIMTDPVMLADGHSYERANITEWLKNHGTSPITNKSLPNKTLTSNHTLKASIQEHLDKLQAEEKRKTIQLPPLKNFVIAGATATIILLPLISYAASPEKTKEFFLNTKNFLASPTGTIPNYVTVSICFVITAAIIWKAWDYANKRIAENNEGDEESLSPRKVKRDLLVAGVTAMIVVPLISVAVSAEKTKEFFINTKDFLTSPTGDIPNYATILLSLSTIALLAMAWRHFKKPSSNNYVLHDIDSDTELEPGL